MFGKKTNAEIKKEILLYVQKHPYANADAITSGCNNTPRVVMPLVRQLQEAGDIKYIERDEGSGFVIKGTIIEATLPKELPPGKKALPTPKQKQKK